MYIFRIASTINHNNQEHIGGQYTEREQEDNERLQDIAKGQTGKKTSHPKTRVGTAAVL